MKSRFSVSKANLILGSFASETKVPSKLGDAETGSSLRDGGLTDDVKALWPTC